MTDASNQDETLAPEGPRVAAPVQKLARGTMLGRYVVIGTIGRGAMGVVVSAYDPELDRKVAIKLLRGGPHDAARSTRGAARLLREAQSLAKLAHPNVVAVYDVGTLPNEGGSPAVFMAMELLVGQTVATWLERDKPGWREVTDVFIAAGRGLEAAHQAGVIHRDFKPDNVLLAANGRVVVVDFGLARADPDPEAIASAPSSSASATDNRLTIAGAVMGTPSFMSPEQAQGRELDPASDQFSFCASLHLGLFGELPYPDAGPWARATWEGTLRAPATLSSVPAWVRAILARGLERDASRRFASMTELLGALGRDPSQGRKRGAAIVAVGTTIAATWWIASHRAATEDACSGAAAAVDDAWGTTRRNAIVTALVDGTERGDAYANRVVEAIDVQVADLRDERIAVCRAALGDDPAVVADVKLKTECLDGVQQQLEALTAILEERGGAVQDTALSAVAALQRTERCRDLAVLRRSAPTRSDPARADDVAQLRIELARARSHFMAGDTEAARDGVAALIDRVREVGDDRLTAEALLIYANGEMQLARFAEGIALAEEAHMLAIADGADLAALNSLGLLTVARTVMIPQFDLADWYSAEAEAFVHRLGDPPAEMARVLTDRARLARKRRDPATEVALLERATALLEVAGVDDQSRVVILDNLAVAYLNASRNHEAVEVLERALEAADRSIGPKHGLRANIMLHLGTAHGDTGDRDRGLVYARKGVELARASYGANHPNLAAALNTLALLVGETAPATALPLFEESKAILAARGQQSQLNLLILNIGDTYRALGDPVRALEHHRAALEHLGDDVLSIVRGHVSVADDLVELGRLEEAERAIAAARLVLAEATPKLSEPHHTSLVAARLAMARGDAAAAVADARRSAAIAQTDATATPTERLDAKFLVARALLAADENRAERLEIAMDAMRAWSMDPRRYRERLAQVLAFFLAHGDRGGNGGASP